MDAIQHPTLNAVLSACRAHPRMHGYYLVGVVEVADLTDRSIDEILDLALERLDNEPWPPAAERPTDQTWLDYETTLETAEQHVVEALVGGNAIGHSGPTMPKETAQELWKQFPLVIPRLSEVPDRHGSWRFCLPISTRRDGLRRRPCRRSLRGRIRLTPRKARRHRPLGVRRPTAAGPGPDTKLRICPGLRAEMSCRRPGSR